ncbi:MAG: AAA family ATPase [Clostridia bacterium]|nr:AAA family ATPase [Clostridia bacterium]
MNIPNVIRKVKEYISDKGFTYADDIVESVFLSLKVKPFVVLCGMPGCGKSSFARLFAAALGATNENGRFKQVSVCSDWVSPARFVGDVTSDGKFIPGVATGFIQRAMGDSELPYFLCIDEMNLSRPEKYLSFLLSLLETRHRGENAEILTDEIFDKDSFGNDISASYSYGGLFIPDNLYIIGTINSDDVSYQLTNKFVDRTNIIELSTPNVEIEFDFDSIKSLKKKYCNEISNDVLRSDYINMGECCSDLEHIEYISKELQKINDILKFSSSALSYRMRDETLMYIHYNRKFGLLDDDAVIDRIIMQKILPRVGGSDQNIKQILVNLFQYCCFRQHETEEDYPNTSFKMYSLMRRFPCRYICSAKKIIIMLRRYEEDGFTSFWQ